MWQLAPFYPNRGSLRLTQLAQIFDCRQIFSVRSGTSTLRPTFIDRGRLDRRACMLRRNLSRNCKVVQSYQHTQRRQQLETRRRARIIQCYQRQSSTPETFRTRFHYSSDREFARFIQSFWKMLKMIFFIFTYIKWIKYKLLFCHFGFYWIFISPPYYKKFFLQKLTFRSTIRRVIKNGTKKFISMNTWFFLRLLIRQREQNAIYFNECCKIEATNTTSTLEKYKNYIYSYCNLFKGIKHIVK